jgi:hypothetical protein
MTTLGLGLICSLMLKHPMWWRVHQEAVADYVDPLCPICQATLR